MYVGDRRLQVNLVVPGSPARFYTPNHPVDPVDAAVRMRLRRTCDGCGEMHTHVADPGMSGILAVLVSCCSKSGVEGNRGTRLATTTASSPSP
jgi:hypothetical protein